MNITNLNESARLVLFQKIKKFVDFKFPSQCSLKMDRNWLLQQSNVDIYFELFNRGSPQQQQVFFDHFQNCKKKEQEQKEQLQITEQKRLSIEEFNEQIRSLLPDNRIKQFLKEAGCRKLYRLLFGNVQLIQVSEDDPVGPIQVDVPVVDDWDENSDGVDPETYHSIFMEILEKINNPNRNSDRLKFHTFLDLCWETVGFDVFSLGNTELVFDQETCPHDSKSYSMANKLHPYKLRELVFNHIRAYFIAKSELANIDNNAFLMQINKHFQGVGNNFILFQSTIL